jgi:hypothetical protein
MSAKKSPDFIDRIILLHLNQLKTGAFRHLEFQEIDD